ncbi:hypothetical protein AAA162_12435 [Parabacteroides johnsonii]|uniref:hypothetical protein n=1 Tax=Parabacteroides johnsonii TaxID=387661 RepID=UPI0032BF948A
MIGLNKIGLNQVQLNRLHLNAPFSTYRKMAGGGGSGDGFPQLPGDVTRWHFGGLTNEMMAAMDDPRLEDADGKGRFLSFKNFLWGGMSGVGGYSDENHLTFYKFTLDDYVFIAIKSGVKYMNFTFRVTGLQPGNKLTLAFFGTTNTVYGTWDKDGIYTVNSAVVEVGKPVYFYNGYGSTRGTFTIEILPLYPGFILGDGVDDYAITEKELNFEDTYTVYTAFIPFQDDPARNMILCGKNDTKDFSINYSGTHLNFKPSTGVNLAVRIDQFALLVCKRNKDITTIINLSTGESRSLKSVEFISNPGLYYLWRNMFATFYAKAAIAGQIIDNGHFTTDEEDENILNWHKKQYPWLFPDQAWTVTGKTNEDEDRATIANITGNGNDLVLSNFGFIEGSGYNEEGGYAGYLVTDGVDDKIMSSAFTVGKDWTTVGEWEFLKEDAIKIAGIAKFGSFRFYNYSLTGRMNVYINSDLGTNVIGDSIKAATSKGSVCLDFNEVTEVTPGDAVDSGQSLFIGYNANNFTKLAFKNLAIYPTVLSKEDCIKAYNYLQTLKAK